jgi:hypothetical protein
MLKKGFVMIIGNNKSPASLQIRINPSFAYESIM